MPLSVALELVHHDARREQFEVAVLHHLADDVDQLLIVPLLCQIQLDRRVNEQMQHQE
jgi:hypothetical protein